MRLEGLIVCSGYGDFLSETLPLNKGHFDRLLVVTSWDDEETQKLCEHLHVECLKTGALKEAGEFNKGAAIDAGLAELDLDDWVLHLDADIVLPPQTRRYLELKRPNPQLLYGCDRYMLPDAASWYEQKTCPRLEHEAEIYLHTDAWPIGTRIVTPDYNGYVPIGFFQLWHPRTAGVRRYPASHGTAGRTDMMHAKAWRPGDRVMLGELIVYHLQSDPSAKQGANWEGRTTKRFVPKPRNRVSRWWRCWRRRRNERRHRHPDHDRRRHRHRRSRREYT